MEDTSCLQGAADREKTAVRKDPGTANMRSAAFQAFGFLLLFLVVLVWGEVYFYIFFISLYFPLFIRGRKCYYSQATLIQLSEGYLSVAVKREIKQRC